MISANALMHQAETFRLPLPIQPQSRQISGSSIANFGLAVVMLCVLRLESRALHGVVNTGTGTGLVLLQVAARLNSSDKHRTHKELRP